MSLSILGARVIDPASGLDQVSDLHIDAGQIIAIGAAPAGFQAAQRIDAQGLVAAPGLVDVNVTVKERGQQSIGLTGGISGYQGSFVGLNYSTNNFLGYGDKIAVDAIIGTKQLNLSFSLTKPSPG